MTLPRYPRYKPTRQAWLGDIPEHWTVKPLWTLYRRLKRTGHSDEELLSVYRDYGVVPKASRDDNNNNPSEDLSTYQLVEPGDLVLNKMKAWQGSVAVSAYRGIVSPAYFVYESLHTEDSRYLHYLMRCTRYITGYLSLSKGIRVNQWDLEPEYHSRMPVLLPPKPEQEAIAAFLDRETAKIDALIAEQEKLIALLAEKRQATISHTVTRGLDPDVPMKDSAVPWIGEVPTHWEVAPLKRFWSVTDCKHLTAEFVDDGYPLASIREVQSRYVALDAAKRTTEHLYMQLIEGDRKPLPGDLIFSRNATVGEVAQVPEEHPAFAMGQDVCLLRRLDASASPDYLQDVLRSGVVVEQLKNIMVGSTFKRVNVEEIRSLTVPMPPPDEQHQIAAFLNNERVQFDALEIDAVRSVSLLRERRSALITAAVTGQIDVRNAVAA